MSSSHGPAAPTPPLLRRLMTCRSSLARFIFVSVVFSHAVSPNRVVVVFLLQGLHHQAQERRRPPQLSTLPPFCATGPPCCSSPCRIHAPQSPSIHGHVWGTKGGPPRAANSRGRLLMCSLGHHQSREDRASNLRCLLLRATKSRRSTRGPPGCHGHLKLERRLQPPTRSPDSTTPACVCKGTKAQLSRCSCRSQPPSSVPSIIMPAGLCIPEGSSLFCS